MDIRKLLGLAVLATGVALTGCGDDDGGGTDAGGGGGTDAGGEVEDTDLPEAQVNGEKSSTDPQLIMGGEPADFSCMGTRTEPAEGDEISFTLTVEDFQEGNPVPDACIEFYPDNVIDADNTCDGMTTDDSGNVTVMDNAGSWYAYRIFPADGPTPATTIVGSVQYNEPSPDMAGDTATGNSVSQATINLIPTVLGFRRVEGTGVLAGTINDCNDDTVYGTRIRAYTADGTRIAEGMAGSAPHYRYFDGEDFPNGSQPWSHVDGLFAAANLPADAAGTDIFLELWGKLSADGEPQLLGCETGKLFPDTVTILNIGPLRADGPTCPGAE